MAKKIKLKIKADELRKKLKVRDGVDGKAGKDGKDGKTPVIDTAKIASEASKRAYDELLPKIPDITQLEQKLPILGEEIRDSLELLTGEERLDKSAIRGLKEIEDKVKQSSEFVQHGWLGVKEITAGDGISVDNTTLGYPIISAPGSTTDEKVKYDAADTTAGYVADKFVAGTGITLTEGTGADENKLKITNSLDLSAYQTTASDNEIHTAMQDPTGFPNRTASAWSITGNKLTVTVVSGSYDIWFNGVKHTISTSKEIDITDVEGQHLVYFDTDDTLKEYVNPTEGELLVAVRDKCLVALIYWDATNNSVVYQGEERHGTVMDGLTHYYLHNTRGLQYVSGLGLGDFVIGNGSLDTHAQFSVATGSISDEDLGLTVSDIASTTGLPILYRDGANGYWRLATQAGYSVMASGSATNRLNYNKLTTGTWSLAEVGEGDYVLCHIFATTGKIQQMYAIMGQNEYTTLPSARAGVQTEISSLLLGNLPSPEIRPIASVIFQTDKDYANTIKARIIEVDGTGTDDYVDWRSSDLPRGVVATDHGSLTGLSDDDHPQYHNDTRADTWLSAGHETTYDHTLIATALQNIVEDTTPQLGGDLDGQSTYDLTNMVDGTFSGTIQGGTLTDGTLSVVGGEILDATTLEATTSLGLEIGDVQQLILTDGKLAPTTDSDIDLGDSTHAFKNVYGDAFITTGGLSTDFVKGDGSLDSSTYLTAEADTLATVTGRGATTTTNIGLGTASPDARLSVQTNTNDITNPAISFKQTNGNTQGYIGIAAGGAISFSAYNNIYLQTDGGAGYSTKVLLEGSNLKLKGDSYKLYFGAGDDASIYYDGSNLKIKPNDVGSGNSIFDNKIGIATSSPTEALTANGNIKTGDSLKFKGQDLNNSGFRIGIYDDAVGTSGGARKDDLVFKTWSQSRDGNDTGQNQIRIDYDGNLKILNDNSKLYFGAGDDSSVTDDGSFMIIDPDAQVAGSRALKVGGDIFPDTDDTYYLGKNDDDTPFAWKGIILKDTTDGKYYRIQVTNGAVEAIDLSD